MLRLLSLRWSCRGGAQRERVTSSVICFLDVKQNNSTKKKRKTCQWSQNSRRSIRFLILVALGWLSYIERKGDPQGGANDWGIGVIMLFPHTSGGGGCSSFIHRLRPSGIGRCCHSRYVWMRLGQSYATMHNILVERSLSTIYSSFRF